MEHSNGETDLLNCIASSGSQRVSINDKGSNALKKPGASSTSHIPSHYYELQQLKPEEDLIQFDSRPPTPNTQPSRLDASVRSPSNAGSSREQSRQ